MRDHDSEYFKIYLSVIIDYDTHDITYVVRNDSSTVFCGIVEVSSSMLGNIKTKSLFSPGETIEFKGNLKDAIICNEGFKKDISIAYLRFPDKNFVVSNKVITEEPKVIKPQSWIYKVIFATLPSTGNLKSIVILNSLNSESEAKDITVEIVYFFGMDTSTIIISPDNEYPNEITLLESKFVFSIPSLAPGQFRIYRFLLTPIDITNTIPILTRVKSRTPLLFQPEQDIIFRS